MTKRDVETAIRVVSRLNFMAAYGHDPEVCLATNRTLAALRKTPCGASQPPPMQTPSPRRRTRPALCLACALALCAAVCGCATTDQGATDDPADGIEGVIDPVTERPVQHVL